ncbi:MAG: hypothetical protein A3B31_01205 [Candidatus Komeilibacteria bacterium RIFCSPLOWO2_01_FULL_53_11]|uniref:AI-2E family transporter n=1 Tax=Candidatus Komeilibacteria bacterium RIFCSPLOWO2_01_FULL_53_11 TaxID=1798552 RepID=A0A1G2BTS5_9BACT|nr:MAG: hypothetical protein A3B31_01205 [Candidatus Komeilibacteria bacterium RIFCSPLOWO2_01_FULL_53_11]
MQFSITTASVVRVILVLGAVWFVWLIRDLVAILFVALILASAFDPTVDYMQKYRFPRALAILIIYVIFFSAATAIIVGIARPIASEIATIARAVPQYYQEINRNITEFQHSSFLAQERVSSLKGGLDAFITNLASIAPNNILFVVGSFFGGVLSIILVFVITFYISVHEGAVKHFLAWIVPRDKSERALSILEQVQHKLGLWLRGQIVLSFIIFLLTYVGLKLLGVEYALVLALLAGMLEVVPYLGPILSAVPAVFLTFISAGWFKGLLVLALYVVIQQAENNFILPKVMSRSVGLNPLVIILSILIGAKVAGVAGALIAVPFAAAVTVYLEEMGYKSKETVA